MNKLGVSCPECDSPDVIVHDDGTCECMDCGYVFYVELG